MVSKQKLIRMIRQMRPEIVAVDNVHELATDRVDLVKLLKQMPNTTKLVQVTGGDRPEALTRIARKYGLSFDRLNPMEEAETGARLAAKGVGHVISAFEDRTWIKVSRRRSPGRGGWSQKRYTRKIHGAVKSLAREVESELRQSGFQFNSHALEGIGGYIRCEFVVEAPRHRVHIRPGYRGDAQIRVEGVQRPRLKFDPLKKRRSYIIAGIDPGTTTGIAALNLKGELVDLLSARAMSPSDVTEWLAETGKPLIVATDVYPTPGAVEKVKRSFNAVLYSPGEDIPSEDKIALAKGYGYKNDHERDALSAAVSAYKKYKNKFQQVKKKCPSGLDPEEVKALVVEGKAIDRAVSELTTPPPNASTREETGTEPDAPGSAALSAKSRRQAEHISRLKEYVEELKEELYKKDEEQKKLKKSIERHKDKANREVKRAREIQIRDKEINRLRGLIRLERKKNRRLKARFNKFKRADKLEKAAEGRLTKVISAFSKEVISDAIKQWLIDEGDVVLLVDASGGGTRTADLLIDKKVEAVITESDMDPSMQHYFMDHDIAVISNQKVPVRRVAGIALINPPDLEKAKEEWSERKQVRLAQQKTEWLEEIVQEYRAERRKMERQKRRERQDSSDSVFNDLV